MEATSELELVRSGGPTEVRVLRHVVVVDFVGSVPKRSREKYNLLGDSTRSIPLGPR
jgi:hypothetical protein